MKPSSGLVTPIAGIIVAAAVGVLALAPKGNSAERVEKQYPREYIENVARMVLSVVRCSNPKVLMGLAADEYDEVEMFKETGRIPYDFKKVELGGGIDGYRADLQVTGGGWGAYRRAWLFELHSGKLEPVFELRGSYLFITDKTVNGRYLLWHWEGSDPLSARQRSIEWRDGKYTEGPLVDLK